MICIHQASRARVDGCLVVYLNSDQDHIAEIVQSFSGSMLQVSGVK